MLGAMKNHKFSETGSASGASKGVIGLLTNIKESLEADIERGEVIESKAQAEFEALIKSSDAEKQQLGEKIEDYRSAKEDRESQTDDNQQWKETEEAELKSVKEEMYTLMGAGDEGKDISLPCEFMFKNFDLRKKRRQSEAEGLREGIQFLQGATAV